MLATTTVVPCSCTVVAGGRSAVGEPITPRCAITVPAAVAGATVTTRSEDQSPHRQCADAGAV